jgi:hypothetical protein
MRDNMSSKTSPSPWKGHGGSLAIRPELGFAAATVLGFGAWGISSATMTSDLVMPIVATLFIAFAAVFGLIACFQRGADPTRVTYLDVAGALTLIGICAAATIEPEQLVRLVEAGPAPSKR